MTNQPTHTPFSKNLIVLYATALLIGTAFGIFQPLISAFMEEQDVNSAWIGLNAALYFLAIALCAQLVEKLLRPFGVRKVMGLGFFSAALLVPLFPLTTSLPLWFMIRILIGFSVCCFLVSGQTALNTFAQAANRSLASGLYFLAMALGFILGSLSGSFFYKNFSPQIAFFGAGGVLLVAGTIAWFALPSRLTRSPQLPNNFLKVLPQLKFPIHGVFAYGIAEATLITIYPIYLLRQAYTTQQISFALSAFILGNIISTIPLTILADKVGKIRVLFFCLCLGIVSILGLTIVSQLNVILILSAIGGATIGPSNPLCLAMVGEQVQAEDRALGTALFNSTYSLGTTIGPGIASVMMALGGGRLVFSLCLPVYVLLLIRMGVDGRRHSTL